MKKQIKSNLLPLVLLAYLLSTLTLFGQENQNNKTLKLYTNLFLTSTETVLDFNDTTNTFSSEKNDESQFEYFTPSFAIILPNGNSQEFELSRLLINTTSKSIIKNDTMGKSIETISSQKTTNIFVAFRYEYNVMFFKNKEDNKVKLYLGFSINPYFSNIKYSPLVSTAFPTNQGNFGMTLSTIPRLNYNWNEKWFIDINIPISIADFYWTIDKVDNPSVPVVQRNVSTYNYQAFPNKFLFRLGLGLRI